MNTLTNAEPFVDGVADNRVRFPVPAFSVVSLLDMLRFYAKEFLEVMTGIHDRAKNGCATFGAEPTDMVSEADTEFLQQMLEKFARYPKAMGLKNTNHQVARLYAMLAIGFGESYESVGLALSELEARFNDELDAETFVYAPKAREYFQTHLFGVNVDMKFPKLTEDIAEAGRCIGLGRYTAGVFHLMRVMEYAVARLAKVLGGGTINVERPWGNILTDIDKAVAMLPGSKMSDPEKDRTRYAKFSEIAAYLHHVKDAWRNNTMHPKKTYTDEEAEHLFRNVKTFMQSLAVIR